MKLVYSDFKNESKIISASFRKLSINIAQV